ncbi:MAG: hypothetical protein HND52_04825 [Ignavibacteriae bacterium]|nr:hypothetical protein [Ignavibacteriota bacterium]NOG97283.1 hypothetical protein [Ignavibacteriota bacterium]
MDYEVSIADNGNYIIIKYYVPMTTEVALKSSSELMDLSEQHNIKRFLFDMRESANVQSITANYNFANKEVQTFEFPRNSLSAFLVRPNDNSHDFITTVFLNAGYAVEKFTSEKKAVNWLTAELKTK